MAKVRETGESGVYMFWCPGCNAAHLIDTTKESQGIPWRFNNDFNKPTFKPGIITNNKNDCALFIEAGNGRYLKCSKHNLSEQTVELPEL